jgi:hypothetical protein
VRPEGLSKFKNSPHRVKQMCTNINIFHCTQRPQTDSAAQPPASPLHYSGAGIELSRNAPHSEFFPCLLSFLSSISLALFGLHCSFCVSTRRGAQLDWAVDWINRPSRPTLSPTAREIALSGPTIARGCSKGCVGNTRNHNLFLCIWVQAESG